MVTPSPAPTAAAPALSQDEAASLVLAQVVKPESLDHEVIVFGRAEPLQPGDVLQAHAALQADPAPTAVTVAAESWFFWLDDAPGARFTHPSRFVLVERASGAVTLTEEGWWPTVNGLGLWTERAEYWNEANWAFSNLEWRPRGQATSRPPHALARLAPHAPVQAGGGLAALVINTWQTGDTLKEDMELDANGMHDALTGAGFDTTYFGPKEDANPHRGGDVHPNAVRDWLDQKATELKAGDTLVLYVTGHGQATASGFGTTGPLWDSGLASYLQNFDPGVHIIVILDTCHSGSFSAELKAYADLTVTSTNSTTSAYSDIDPSEDPNPDDQGGEFTSGFIADWNEILADPARRKIVEQNAKLPGRNFWEALTAASFESAVAKDAAYLTGKTTPLITPGDPQTKPRPVLPTGKLQARSDDIFDPAKHFQYIKLPELFDVTVMAGSVIFDGPDPWVDVRGEWSDDGSFEADGQGTVAGFPNVTVAFTGTLTEDGLLGFYTMGAGGELPTGQPIIYRIDGTWLERDQPATAGAGTETIEAFLALFIPARRGNDQAFLLARLHPAVLALYGMPQCQRSLAERVPDPTENIEPLESGTLGSWAYAVDGRSIDVAEVLTVAASSTRDGETTMRELHFGIVEGKLYWFTDCGDPPP
jgi:hypothetical protein